MSYNGSGTFLINSTGQPVVANTVISATVFNALTSDLATGLSTAITKDGQTTITANIPFGSNKITGLGAGTAATDAANLGQVQSTVAKLITVTGTDTITGTMSPALTAYAAGQLFYFVANAANTGAVTINIDGLGAKSITRDGATALAAGDINSGEFVVVIYDGTRFQMINAANSFGNTTINGTLTVTGNTGLQANVSITSTLSVGGTFAVTGAATLGSTLAVAGKSDLPTVSTASINAAVAVVTGLTATGASIASMNAGVALLTTATVTTLTATGASIASANIGNLQFTAASIASINAGVAVITNLTATGASIASANVGTAVITTGTVTNLTATSASVASANAGVALITTGTVTNLTSTSASIASANVGTAVVTGLTVTGASIASVNAGVAVLSGNLTLSGGTANGVLYLNGSKVATSGSGFTYDGTSALISGGNLRVNRSSDATVLTLGGSPSGNYEGDIQLTTSNTQINWRIATNRVSAGALTFTPSTAGGGSTFTTPAMTIDNASNVGIGTGSPTYKLDLSVTTNNGIRTTSSAGQQSYLGNTGGEAVTGTLNNYGFGIITNGSIRGYFDTSGNLGIGTSSPANKLSINQGSSSTAGLLISGTSSPGLLITETSTPVSSQYGNDASAAYLGTTTNHPLIFRTNGTERARITAGGDFLVGQTTNALADTGHILDNDGLAYHITNGLPCLTVNRKTSDGTLVDFLQDGTSEGTISVSGNTVSYNSFAGSHWSQLQDGSKPDILRGTVMDSINELCVWPDENNERLPKAKVSDTAGSKKVYGVFMAWDNDWTETNDMYVTAVGAFICRINGSVTVQEGDLLESNGDGTARVQADDIIRSSTIGKVTSTVKTHQYDDGSYCVPTVLYCG